MIFLLRSCLSAIGLLLAISATAFGCPFCTALEPTLASRRESAAVVALGEVRGIEGRKLDVRLHRTLKGEKLLAGQDSIVVPAAGTLKVGTLLLVFGDLVETEADEKGNLETQAVATKGESLRFAAVPVSETSYAYFAQAPDLRKTAPERLRYFARFLEHADPTIAGDAYQEFAHASFGDVAQAADALPGDKLIGWLASERVPPARKGFYALALSFNETEPLRRFHADVLFKMILAPSDDFRAGFDGVIGGYLLLRGASGLDQIDELYLSNPKAADGDVRHALAALRFYREFGDEIPRERLAKALRHVLARPEFADAVVTDLARWKDWSALDEIAGLYTQDAYAQPAVRRAIVGYLLACPEAAAAVQLKRLRGIDPQGVAAAEQVLSALGGSRQ
jgi:hypothetical protein